MRTIKTIPDSMTVAINSIAQQKLNAGIKIFNLSTGEPKLPPHPMIIKAVDEALSQSKTFYPLVGGLPELKQLAAEWMNQWYNCSFNVDNCLVVNGGKFDIYILLQLLLQKNDEVIIAAPYWVSYPEITKLFDGQPVIIKTKESEQWKLTGKELKKACTINSKILIINNACNPTGALYTRLELENLLKIAAEHNLLVISDEVYSGLTYDNHHFVSCGEFSEYKDRVIIIQSCSKNFAMSGWRVGFVFGPGNIIKPLTSLISQSTSGVTTISQWAAIMALKQASEMLQWIRGQMQERRELVVKAINHYFGLTLVPPASSLYLFISLKSLNVENTTSLEFCTAALEKGNVALVPGSAFGQEGYIRISFGADNQELIQGIEALYHFCKNIA